MDSRVGHGSRHARSRFRRTSTARSLRCRVCNGSPAKFDSVGATLAAIEPRMRRPEDPGDSSSTAARPRATARQARTKRSRTRDATSRRVGDRPASSLAVARRTARQAFVRLVLRRRRSRAADLDDALATTSDRTCAVSKRRTGVAVSAYAIAGQPDRAANIKAQWTRDGAIPELEHRDSVCSHRMRGEIALRGDQHRRRASASSASADIHRAVPSATRRCSARASTSPAHPIRRSPSSSATSPRRWLDRSGADALVPPARTQATGRAVRRRRASATRRCAHYRTFLDLWKRCRSGAAAEGAGCAAAGCGVTRGTDR